ncbi:MAG: DNA -binding domain-containing protein [Bacillota bacterium]
MQAETASWPDWRDAAAYAPLLDADRSLFAWEWLRRDPRYRAAAEKGAGTPVAASGACAAEFGLVTFEHPCLAVPLARPVWRAESCSFVLPVDLCRGPVAADDEIDVDRLHDLARIIADERGEHLLLSDGLRLIRLDGPPRAFTAGAVCLRYSIQGRCSAEAPLLTLRRFLALCRSGSFSNALHRREAKARRWIMMLRAHDAIAAGADQRRIAEWLLSRSVVEARWRTRESSVRSQVQRIVRASREISRGGYRRLLR